MILAQRRREPNFPAIPLAKLLPGPRPDTAATGTYGINLAISDRQAKLVRSPTLLNSWRAYPMQAARISL
jgi:hypothetical protein